jgi:hypothetical protein
MNAGQGHPDVASGEGGYTSAGSAEQCLGATHLRVGFHTHEQVTIQK